MKWCEREKYNYKFVFDAIGEYEDDDDKKWDRRSCLFWLKILKYNTMTSSSSLLLFALICFYKEANFKAWSIAIAIATFHCFPVMRLWIN